MKELARAVYLRSKVVLLDGVLSALDRQSAAAILKQLVGEGGLLRTLGTTVIMTTHSGKCQSLLTLLHYWPPSLQTAYYPRS